MAIYPPAAYPFRVLNQVLNIRKAPHSRNVTHMPSSRDALNLLSGIQVAIRKSEIWRNFGTCRAVRFQPTSRNLLNIRG